MVPYENMLVANLNMLSLFFFRLSLYRSVCLLSVHAHLYNISHFGVSRDINIKHIFSDVRIK